FGQRGATNGGVLGGSRGWVKFESIDLSSYDDVKVSFYWSGEGNVTQMGYFLAGTTDGSVADFTAQTDTGSAANTSTMLGTTTLITSTVLPAGGSGGFLQNWTEVSFDVDNSITSLSFALFGTPDSTSRMYGWDDVTVTAVPEPGTLMLVGISLLSLFMLRKRK
nr:PEP-CTERM sorting domain-containing protein [Kiritimatiellia bacterium]